MRPPPPTPDPDQPLLWAAYQETLQLREQLATARQQIAELTRSLERITAELEHLRQRHTTTADELALLTRKLYGRSCEREAATPPRPDSPTPEATADPTTPPAGSRGTGPPPTRRPRRARRLDLTRLPHVRHHQDLPEAEKVCPCCRRAKDRIGEDVATVLEYVPAKVEVHEHVRPKYACRYCKAGVHAPPAPARPIPRSPAGPGLLAHILVGKYADHLPLYRQEDILLRHGLRLARSTLCDWVAAAAEALRPLYDLQRRRVLRSEVLWTDDTPVTVLGGTEGRRQGRFWAYLGDASHPYTVYDFTLSRSRDGPQRFLADFAGYLHADAYAGYDAIYLGPAAKVVEVACWAHARRKFFEAKEHAPREAGQILGWIGHLYDIEDRARDFTAEARRHLRQREAEPVLDRIGAYLAGLAKTLLPKSRLAQAVTYARNQWAALRRYTTDGRLTIDNNASERAMRTPAVGRNTWLFVGSRDAGPRAAIVYTLLGGAKRHHLEPWAYLHDALRQAAEADPNWEDLLPERWAKAHPEAVLSDRLEEARRRAERQRDRRQRRRERQIDG